MAGGASNDPNATISGINMTPFIDIMLVLLIIFIVTARLTAAPPNAIPLNLPKSSTGDAAVLTYAISLGKSGEIVVNGDRLPNDDALLANARQFHLDHPEARAIINADGDVLHKRVIHILDLLAQADVTQIAFGVSLVGPPASK